MKRSILLLLLLSSIASQTFSQDSIRYWITAEQHAKIFQLRDDNRAMAIGIQFLQQENSILQFENDSLQNSLDEIILRNQIKLDSIRKVLYRDSAKISQLERKIIHSEKVIASKDIAIDKWKRGYYQNLKFRKEFVWNTIGKWIEIGGVAGIICLAVYGGMWLSQNVDLSLTL